MKHTTQWTVFLSADTSPKEYVFRWWVFDCRGTDCFLAGGMPENFLHQTIDH